MPHGVLFFCQKKGSLYHNNVVQCLFPHFIEKATPLRRGFEIDRINTENDIIDYGKIYLLLRRMRW